MVVTAQTDISAAYDAAQCVARTHERLAGFLRAGQTLAEVDRFVAETLNDLKCRSAFIRYQIPKHPPFPSHSCLSPNDCIVHGTHQMTGEPTSRSATATVAPVTIGIHNTRASLCRTTDVPQAGARSLSSGTVHT